MPGLANSWFQGSSVDPMIVKDAYEISTSTNVNTQYGSVKGIYSEAIGGLYSNKSSVRTLLDLVQQSKAGTINKTELLNRALGAMGSSLPSLLGSLGGALAGRITDAAGLLLGQGAADTVSVLYKNLPEKLISAANITDYQDMSEFLIGITGDSELMKLIHVEAESAIIGGLATELMQFGIPSIVDDAISQARSDEVRANAYAFVSTSAVKGSDLVMVNSVIDNIGLTLFLEANPNAINDVLSSYYLGTDDTVDIYPERRAYLIQTLVRINANWDKWLHNGAYIPNFEPFSVSSGDAKKLFSMTEPHRSYVMASPPYTPRTVNTVCTELYPDAYFT